MCEHETQPATPDAPLRRFSRKAMACVFEVLLVEPDETYAEQAAHAALAEADRLECELSRYIETSDIANINALKPGKSVRVGVDTIECLKLSATVYEETNAAFDVTFGSESRADRRNAPLIFDPVSRLVGVSAAGVRVDLGGIGKGYAVDCIATILREWSIESAMVHSGQSTVLAIGHPSDADCWSVAVRDPENQADSLGDALLRNTALAGSGRRIQGDHILDPRTGQPVTDKLGAWAIAPSAALADALSTAFMVMSVQEIEAYCREHGDVSARIRVQTGDGPKTISHGAGWRC